MYEFFYVVFVLVALGAAWYFIIRPLGIKLPGLPRFGKLGRKTGGLCPFCFSDDVVYSTKRDLWTCYKCREVFHKPSQPVKLPKTPTKVISKEDLEALLRFVPDEFQLNATAFLNGTNSDKVWLELFSYKYPKWYRDFMNLYIGVTKK